MKRGVKNGVLINGVLKTVCRTRGVKQRVLGKGMLGNGVFKNGVLTSGVLGNGVLKTKNRVFGNGA